MAPVHPHPPRKPHLRTAPSPKTSTSLTSKRRRNLRRRSLPLISRLSKRSSTSRKLLLMAPPERSTKMARIFPTAKTSKMLTRLSLGMISSSVVARHLQALMPGTSHGFPLIATTSTLNSSPVSTPPSMLPTPLFLLPPARDTRSHRRVSIGKETRRVSSPTSVTSARGCTGSRNTSFSTCSLSWVRLGAWTVADAWLSGVVSSRSRLKTF